MNMTHKIIPLPHDDRHCLVALKLEQKIISAQGRPLDHRSTIMWLTDMQHAIQDTTIVVRFKYNRYTSSATFL